MATPSIQSFQVNQALIEQHTIPQLPRRQDESWEERTREFRFKDQQACTERTRSAAMDLLGELNRIDLTNPREGFRGSRLAPSSHPLCLVGNSNSAAIDSGIAELKRPAPLSYKESLSPMNPLMPFPKGHGEHHGSSLQSLAGDFALGSGFDRFHHKFGSGPTRVLETATEAARKEAEKDSKNPNRDRIVSGAVEVGIGEVVGAVSGFPAYITIVGSHAVAALATEVEPVFNKAVDSYSKKGYVDHAVADPFGSGLNLKEQLHATQKLLQTLRLPSQMIHSVHHAGTEIATDALDEAGITEENISKGVEALRKALEAHGAILDTEDLVGTFL